jgi:hypothetical protein
MSRYLPIAGNIFKHYKGEEYTIVGIGKLAENVENLYKLRNGQQVLMYSNRQGDIFVSSIEQFSENVTDNFGNIVSRFTKK